jgi:predicted ester cyclase
MEGIPATGNTINQESIIMYHLTNGKIDDGRLAIDNLSFMRQLGVIPTPEAA